MELPCRNALTIVDQLFIYPLSICSFPKVEVFSINPKYGDIWFSVMISQILHRARNVKKTTNQK